MAAPTLALAVALALSTSAPSATTLAALKLFAVNVDRQWPSDDTVATAVTGESLRLMATAARGMADDFKIEDGKLRDAMADFDAARDELFHHPRGDKKRPELARDTLNHGRVIIDRLAVALRCDKITEADRASLEKLAKDFDDDRPVREQVDALENYFQLAAKLLRSITDHASSPLT